MMSGHEAFAAASEAGPAPKRIVVAYGFWIFLLSDIVMFSALFAAYAVLVRATAGGPTGAQLFNQVSVAIETACLLASSYTCGMMSLAVGSRRRAATYFFAVRHIRARGRVPRSRDPRVRRHDRPAARPRNAARSFPRSSRLSAATGCTSPPG